MSPQVNIKQELKSNYLLLTIDGYLTARYILSIRSSFNEAIEKNKNVAIELSGIQLIDSMGIGILVNFYKQVKKKGGRLALVNPSEVAKDIFEVSDMDKWLPIHSNQKNIDAIFN